GKSVVGVKKSDITYKGHVWYLNEKNDRLNKVSFDDNFNEIHIDSLVLSHQNEMIQVAGMMRDSTYKDLRLMFSNVDVGKITPEIDSLQVSGNLNGKLDFLQKDGVYFPNSSLTIDDVIINDILFGNLDLAVEGNEDLTRYDIRSKLVNKELKALD